MHFAIIISYALLFLRLMLSQYRIIMFKPKKDTNISEKKKELEYLATEFIAGLFCIGYIVYFISNYD